MPRPALLATLRNRRRRRRWRWHRHHRYHHLQAISAAHQERIMQILALFQHLPLHVHEEVHVVEPTRPITSSATTNCMYCPPTSADGISWPPSPRSTYQVTTTATKKTIAQTNRHTHRSNRPTSLATGTTTSSDLCFIPSFSSSS